MTYSIEAAKAQFQKLLRLAEKGEEVIITEEDKPVAKLVSLPHPPSVADLPNLLQRLGAILKDDRLAFSNDIARIQAMMNSQQSPNPWAS